MGPRKSHRLSGNKTPAKPVMATTAAPMASTKPARVAGTRSTAGRSAAPAKPVAPAAPLGRGPRSRTPRQYER